MNTKQTKTNLRRTVEEELKKQLTLALGGTKAKS